MSNDNVSLGQLRSCQYKGNQRENEALITHEGLVLFRSSILVVKAVHPLCHHVRDAPGVFAYRVEQVRHQNGDVDIL